MTDSPSRGRLGQALLPIALPVVLLFSLAGCGPENEGPIGKATGPETVEGPLTRTPIEFVGTEDALFPPVVAAERGRLVVPERRDLEEGEVAREIAVGYVRFASTGENPGSPIVYLAGGPGGSGIWSASGDRFELFQQMRAVGDVIAFDQRGTWGAEPYMICPGSWSFPLDRPLEEASLREALAPFLAECRARWEGEAEISAYNTLESAHDLEALRLALGAEKLVLWGISYGTHLGLTYMREFPDRVDRAIFAGVEGPDDTLKLPSRLDAVLRRVGEAIEADPQAHQRLPDLLSPLGDLVASLEREPAVVELQHPETGEPVSVTLGVQDLQRTVRSVLGSRREIAGMLEQGISVLEGDLTAVALSAIEARQPQRELVMSLTMDCASWVSDSRERLIAEQSEDTILGDSNARLRAICGDWPARDLGEGFRAAVQSDVPTLLISGTLDGRTPLENAEAVLVGLTNGRHLILDGAAHDDDLLLSSPEIAQNMIEFLRGGSPVARIDLGTLEFKLPR